MASGGHNNGIKRLYEYDRDKMGEFISNLSREMRKGDVTTLSLAPGQHLTYYKRRRNWVSNWRNTLFCSGEILCTSHITSMVSILSMIYERKDKCYMCNIINI